MATGNSERVREYARREYIDPARKRGDVTVRIVAGEVQKALSIQNRIAQVCDALTNTKFLGENKLILERAEGPPSGTSTTMQFTYRLVNANPTRAGETDPFLRLYGIAKGLFGTGEWESSIRYDREHFYASGKDPLERE